MDVDSVPLSSDLKEKMWVPGPDGDMYYNMRYFWGFVQIQDMLDQAIIQSQGHSPVGVYLQQFPYPCFKRDNYNSGLYTAQIIPVALIFGFSLIVAISVRDNVWEKESQNIQLMRVMGVNYSDILLANFSLLLVINIVDTSLLTIILYFGGLMPYSNPAILYLVIFSFGMSVIMFIFLLSMLLEKASSGSVAAFLIFIITFLPFIIIISLEEQVHFLLKMAANLFMSTSFGFCLLYMTRYEQRGEGSQWENLTSSPLDDDESNLLISLVFLLVDTALYFILAVLIGKFTSLSGQLGGRRRRKLRSHEREDEPGSVSGIHITGLRKHFRLDRRKTKVAVDIEELLIPENEITGLLGHNGAGKSTTISMITGMLPPTEGQIRIKNSENNDIIGYCPQFSILYDNLTVREHLEFYANLKSNQGQGEKGVTLMMSKMNILDKSETLSCNLSEGMRRRLSVGIAFIGDSKVVVLDEPTSGVDPRSRKDIWRLISQYKEGRTILVSTHYMDEAEALCDKIIILDQGQMVETGTSKELQSRHGLDLKLEIQTEVSTEVSSVTSRVSTPSSLVSSNNRIDEHVSSLCPTIRRDGSASHRKRVYTLPSKDLKDLSLYQKLFAVLENEKEILNIKSFSISSPSLEDIFLGIVSNSETRTVTVNKSKKGKVVPEDVSVSKSTLLSDVSSTSSGYSSVVSPLAASVPQPDRQGPLTRLLYQVSALLLKRGLNFLGNKRMILLTFFIPTVLLVLAMVTATIRPVTRTPKILLTPSMYGPGSVSFTSNVNHEEDNIMERFFKEPGIGTTCMENFTSEASTHYVACSPLAEYSYCSNCTVLLDTACSCSPTNSWQCRQEEGGITVRLSTENTTDVVYNLGDLTHPNTWILNTFDQFIEERYGGWRLGAERELTDRVGVRRENAVVWYNNKGFHAVSGYLNAINNARLRAAVQAEPERFGITAYSHPIRGKASQVTGQSLEQHISDYSLSLLMAVVLTFLPASSIIYLIEERTTEQKLVQRTYKAGPLTYWTAVFLWDLCRDLLFLSLAALVIFLFQVRSFTANQNLGASLVLMLLYCTASNSLVYLLEKCFREPSMGQIIVLTSFIFISLLTSITMLMLTMFWWIRPLQKAKEFLEIFLLIFPPYALSKSD